VGRARAFGSVVNRCGDIGIVEHWNRDRLFLSVSINSTRLATGASRSRPIGTITFDFAGGAQARSFDVHLIFGPNGDKATDVIL